MEERKLKAFDKPVDAVVRLPGSKSITNRALPIAALADGTSRLSNALVAEDTRLMVEALQRLGVRILFDQPRATATVEGVRGYWPESEADLYCGNAGTVMRFLTSLCAIGQGRYRLAGSERMHQRPIGHLVDALRDLGAQIGYELTDGCPPITVAARGLRGREIRLTDIPSSQFISALLLAAPYATDDVMIELHGAPVSEPYVTMTIALMERFGVIVVHEDLRRFIIAAPQRYQSCEMSIEPDASAASYFFAMAAATGGRVTVPGLGGQSLQGDARFVDLLERMGCRVERTESALTVIGPVGGEQLIGVDVDMNDMPDVAPTLAVLALFARGETRIRNVGNLRVKECDRLQALAEGLSALGADVGQQEDGLIIRPPNQPAAATIDTYNDHRMAMCFAVAAAGIDGVRIANPACVDKTFPDFFERLENLRG